MVQLFVNMQWRPIYIYVINKEKERDFFYIFFTRLCYEILFNIFSYLHFLSTGTFGNSYCGAMGMAPRAQDSTDDKRTK